MTLGDELPSIDITALLAGDAAASAASARAIEAACRSVGFFYITGHGIGAATLARLDRASRAFFALPLPRKMDIAMARGGRAWRGYFPVGGEQTSGKADRKQGLYFGEELAEGDPRVRAGWPLHGKNLFPADVPELRPAVLQFMAEAERAGQAVLAGIARSLGMRATYFRELYTARPTLLFRIFEYPPEDSASAEGDDATWGVGEHTDYGLLTLLAQDTHGGLEVHAPHGWVAAPPREGALVCNIGDMLDRLTGGLYRSTPHRVRNRSGHSRLSFPFFLDPAFDAEVVPLPGRAGEGGGARWDHADLRTIRGPYRDYLLGKVAKVFPDLAAGLER